jgi:hypothetical protein
MLNNAVVWSKWMKKTLKAFEKAIRHLDRMPKIML